MTNKFNYNDKFPMGLDFQLVICHCRLINFFISNLELVINFL